MEVRRLKTYSKAFAMVLFTIISAIVAALTDDVVTTAEWINIAILGFGAAQVFTAPNVPYSKYTKTILAALTAAATALVSFLTNGVSTAEWLQVLVAVGAAVGVYVAPRSSNY
jgi:hypothetical protein